MRTVAAFIAAFIIAAAAGADDACIPTAPDHLGPYYIADMPVLKNINRFGKSGEPLTVTGVVRAAAAGNPPVAKARLEVWQTDGGGDYHPHNSGKRADYADEDLDMRGTIISDEQGRYVFHTVAPGAEGFFARAKHFHYRITAAGFKTLITQHYLSENGNLPGGKCRSAAIIYNADGATFPAPPIYLEEE
jgi:protocatechuate 3,4-dioxygenase beta subunit